MEELTAIERYHQLKKKATERGYPWPEAKGPDRITRIMIAVAVIGYLPFILGLIGLIVFGFLFVDRKAHV